MGRGRRIRLIMADALARLIHKAVNIPRRRLLPNGKSLRREYLGDKDEQE